MRQFIAILKDSFREALDAKIIWVLLGLSVLVCVLTFSISFKPEPPARAFEEVTSKFGYAVPDQGKANIPMVLPVTKYAVSDINPTGSHYSLKLTATASPQGTFQWNGPMGPRTPRRFPERVDGKEKEEKDPVDSLRYSVVNWMRPAGKMRALGFSYGGPFEAVQPDEVTPEQAARVTDDEMCRFVAQLFDLHGGMNDVAVKRITATEPAYAFDVTVRSTDAVRGWPQQTTLFFGALPITKEFPLGVVLWFIEEKLINRFGASFTLLIGVIITGFFIPQMLRKGALDLLITKPISRPALLIYKYIGGLTYMFILTVTTVGGIWLVLALRSGYWNPNFLLLIPILTFTFAILYSFSTLIAVLTRSAVAAILLTCGFAFLLWLVGIMKISLDEIRADKERSRDVSQTLCDVVDGLQYILPHYKDVDRLTSKLIADATLTQMERFQLTDFKAEYPGWGETFGFSVGFIAVMLGLASWRFQTRDS
jgi:ABC-type transport system involved in multi-copper enzyme maturation permease subunit